MKHLDTRNFEVIRESVNNILIALGADVSDPGLQETPTRVAKMFDEVFEGMRYTNDDIAVMFDKCFEDPSNGDLVLVKDIEAFSWCEHHMALMYNMKIHVAYIPNGKVIGLSKIARIAEMVCKRLQLQERIGHDIADVLFKILDTPDIMVVVEGEHSCMTARGVRARGSSTRTASVHGLFRDNTALRAEVYDLIKE